jgi:hypothetical protein
LASNSKVAGTISPSSVSLVISTVSGSIGGATTVVTNSNESNTCLIGAGNGVAAKLLEGAAAVVVVYAVAAELPS